MDGPIINHNPDGYFEIDDRKRAAALSFGTWAIYSARERQTMTAQTDSPPDYKPRIHDLPSNDRPRERLAREGAAVLSNAELLAILLRVGVAGANTVRAAERPLAPPLGPPAV